MLQCDEQAKTGEYLVKLFPAFCSFCYLRDDDILVLLDMTVSSFCRELGVQSPGLG